MSSLSALPPLQPLAIDPASLSALPHPGLANGQPGPSKDLQPSVSSAVLRRVTPAPKRRRTDSVEPVDVPAALQSVGQKKDNSQKKKKASRACALCQKAHLTCDDSRPCQRCTKRGVADQCVEGHRKRAKYLLDDDELEELKRKKGTNDVSAVVQPAPPPPPQTQPPVGQPLQSSPPSVFSPTDPLFNTFTFDPGLFGSEAAGLEYSYMSQMLGKTSPDSQHDHANSPPSATQSSSAGADFPAAWAAEVFAPYASPAAGLYGDDFPGANFLASPALASKAPPPAPASPTQPLHPLAPRFPTAPADSSFVFGPAAYDRDLGHSALEGGSNTRGDEVYAMVTKPYDYTEGYHYLMKTLPYRFEKNDILRIVRALAIFRPSLIALQMPLTEEDEVFVEKSLQRSLIELNKLISFVGTPTVVWRRTGEICLVGPEFCMLTDWSKEDLLGKRKYIWELFENQSVVEYWENFATHAFENTTQSVYSHCVLLKPDGSPVPATFCFHIRRDIFDLPSLVIGQWLPLL